MNGVTPEGYDGIAFRLAALRAQAGAPSFAKIVQRIAALRASKGRPRDAPGRATVHHAFQAGRRRIDSSLVLEIAVVLGGAGVAPEWRELIQSAIQYESQRTLIPRPRTAPVHAPLGLIGREAGLASLVADVRERYATAPTAPIAVITGLPGVGKTALLRAAAVALGTSLSLPTLGVSLGSAASGDGASEGGMESAASVVIQSVRDALPGGRSSGQGVVLVVDNVSSEEELFEIVRGIPQAAVVLAGSRSSLEVGKENVTLRLQPLGESAAMAILRSDLSGDRIGDAASLQQLASLTGGIPFALTLLAAQIRTHPDWTLEDHVFRLAHSAPDLNPMLADAYDSLTPVGRRTLHLAAMHPGQLSGVDLELLAAGDAVDASELLRAHLLVENESGRLEMNDTVRALAQAKARAEVPLSRLQLGTEQLAEALLTSLGDETLASELVVTTAQLAAELGLSSVVSDLEAGFTLPLERAQLLADALQLLDVARHYGVRERRENVERQWMLMSADLYLRSDELLSVARRRASNPQDPLYVEALIDLADVMFLLYEPTGEIRRILEQAYQLALDRGDDHLVSRAGITLAWADATDGRVTEALARLDPVRRAAQRAEEATYELAALYGESAWLLALDEIRTAKAASRRLIALAAESDARLYRQLGGAVLAEASVLAGEPAVGLEFAERTLDEMRGTDDLAPRLAALHSAAAALMALGRYDDARAQIAAALALPTEPADLIPRADLAEVDLLTGDLEAAERGFASILAAAHATVAERAHAELRLGDVALARQQPGPAREHWLRALEIGALPRDRRELERRLAGRGGADGQGGVGAESTGAGAGGPDSAGPESAGP